MSEHHHDGRPRDAGRPEPERPRSEPEIILPHGKGGEGRGAHGQDPRVFVYVDRDGNTQRVNISTPGPLTIILILLAVGLVAAVIFAVILGALVFLIPIAAIALAGLIGYFYARGLWARWRGR